jgi:hypothetical protein
MLTTTNIAGLVLLLGVLWYLAKIFMTEARLNRIWPDIDRVPRPSVTFGPLGYIVIAAPRVTIIAHFQTESLSIFRQHWDVAITAIVPIAEADTCSRDEAISIASHMVKEHLAKKGSVFAYISNDFSEFAGAPKMPNEAPEPTLPSVTPAAGQPSRRP